IHRVTRILCWRRPRRGAASHSSAPHTTASSCWQHAPKTWSLKRAALCCRISPRGLRRRRTKIASFQHPHFTESSAEIAKLCFRFSECLLVARFESARSNVGLVHGRFRLEVNGKGKFGPRRLQDAARHVLHDIDSLPM